MTFTAAGRPERPWRVRRTGGLLIPGFTKRFTHTTLTGATYLWGVRIGKFDVCVAPDGSCELQYRRWPVVDNLTAVPLATDVATHVMHAFESIGGTGRIRLRGNRRMTFCTFTLEPPATPGR